MRAVLVGIAVFLMIGCGEGGQPARPVQVEQEESMEDNFDDDEEILCEDQQADVQVKVIVDRYQQGR